MGRPPMTDALILCVSCMRFECARPGKCRPSVVLTPPYQDPCDSLWLSFLVPDFDRPAAAPEGASSSNRPVAPSPEK